MFLAAKVGIKFGEKAKPGPKAVDDAQLNLNPFLVQF